MERRINSLAALRYPFTAQTKEENTCEEKNHDRVPVGVLDFETDPFRYGRIPFLSLAVYISARIPIRFYGVHVSSKIHYAKYIRYRDVFLYAHNGGKFDFFYLVEFREPGENACTKW